MEKIKIKIIRKKSLGVFPSILVGLIFAGLFSTAVYVFALPYSPGETTNPTCGPTDTNCTVTASAAYSFGSNNFSGSGNFTTTGTGSFSSLTLTTTALSVGNGGTGLGSIAVGSILGANTLNALVAITSTSGTKILTNTNGTISWETSSGTTPGGSNTQVQYNSSGSFAGSANLTFDGTTLTAGGFTTTGVGTFGSNANVSQLVIKANASQSNSNPLAIFYKSDGTTELFRIHSDSPHNLFIGLNAGRVNSQVGGGSNGLYNTFIGSNAGYANTTGAWNTALGEYALYSNTIGQDNTAIGFDTLKSNTIGYNNTAIGSETLFSNTEGIENVAVGEATLNSNTIGSSNIAMGGDSLHNNTEGNDNIAIGRQTLQSNTTGNYNVAMGRQTLNYTKTGSNNTAVGYQAGYGVADQSFSNNSLFGYQAGFYLKTGGNNVLIGYQAGYNVNAIPATGTGNVFIGYQAGYSETMANNLLYISNSNTATPLIYGDFSTSALTINGTLAITGGISGNLDITGDVSAANLNPSTWNAKADYSFGANNFSGTGGFTTTGLGTFGSLLLTNPASRFLPIWTDFTGSVANNVALSAPWLGLAIGVGTPSIGAGTANHPGLLTLKSHATTVNSGYGYNLSGAAFLIAGGEETEFIFQAYTPTGGVNTTYMGFHDATSVTAPVDAVMFNIVDMVIDGRNYSNSSTSTTASSYTMTTATWYRGKITVNSDATSITFTLYSEAGASLWTDTLTTNIPTGAGRVLGNGILGTNSNPGTAQNIYAIDFISVSINRALTR